MMMEIKFKVPDEWVDTIQDTYGLIEDWLYNVCYDEQKELIKKYGSPISANPEGVEREMKIERIEQQAIINDKVITFDFKKDDLIKTKGDNIKGIVKKVESPFVFIEWIDEDMKKRRGSRWMVDGVEHVTDAP